MRKRYLYLLFKYAECSSCTGARLPRLHQRFLLLEKAMGLEAVVALTFLWEQIGAARPWIINSPGICQERWEKDLISDLSGKLIFIFPLIGSWLQVLFLLKRRQSFVQHLQGGCRGGRILRSVFEAASLSLVTGLIPSWTMRCLNPPCCSFADSAFCVVRVNEEIAHSELWDGLCWKEA